MPGQSHKRFGAYLKRLRKRRGIPVQRVADLSPQISKELAGRLSQPYLSQIERGLRVAVSLPKLFTLAAIYNTRIEDLIGAAPAGLRAKLLRNLEAWRLAERPQPDRCRVLPDARTRVTYDMLEHLAYVHESSGFRIDPDDERLGSCCITICWLAVVPYFACRAQKLNLVPAFRAARQADIEDHLQAAHPLNRRAIEWYGVASEFLEWLKYDRESGLDLVQMVGAWSVDIDPVHEAEWPLSCTFSDPALERRYGCVGVPIGVVEAVCWRQLARALFDGGLRTLVRDCPEPPSLAEVPVEALADLIVPQWAGPLDNLTGGTDRIAVRISAFIAAFPELRPEPDAAALGEARKVAAFIRRAAEPVVSPAPQPPPAVKPASSPPRSPPHRR